MKHISALEKAVMQIIWDSGENYPTLRGVCTALTAIDGTERNISSVMTIISRLADKGYLNPVKKFRKPTYFEPLVSETEYKAYMTEEFIDGVHRGQISSFVLSLLQNDRYAPDDIAKMRSLLDKAGE